MPDGIVQELRTRGCKIPKKNGVIRGEFFSHGQSDWATLCSSKEATMLLVFPGGSRERVAVLDTRPKGFSKWSISVITPEQLKLTWPWTEPQPADIDHQGIFSWIEFGQPGQCLYCYSAHGITQYCHRGRWLAPAETFVN